MLYASKTAKKPKLGVVGVNIGANAKSINKVLDYTTIFEFLAHLFDYVTINVSSPNTKNLRDLQKPELLEKILKNVNSQKKGTLEKLSLLAPAGIVRIASENKDKKAIANKKGIMDKDLAFFLIGSFFFDFLFFFIE